MITPATGARQVGSTGIFRRRAGNRGSKTGNLTRFLRFLPPRPEGPDGPWGAGEGVGVMTAGACVRTGVGVTAGSSGGRVCCAACCCVQAPEAGEPFPAPETPGVQEDGPETLVADDVPGRMIGEKELPSPEVGRPSVR